MRKRIIAALGAVSAIALFATACSTDNTGNGGTKVEKSSSSKKSEVKYYKLGETVKVGDVEYTLKSVEKTDERNEFEDSKPANVIKVVYHVKNDGKEDIFIFIGFKSSFLILLNSSKLTIFLIKYSHL